jgi:hypothetical protein
VKTIRENGATSGAGVLATFTYDDLGRRVLLMRGNQTRTDYGYDPVSRLESLGLTFPASQTRSATFDFAYNKAGQIANKTSNKDDYAFAGLASGTETSTVNGQNQLLTHKGVGITYDAKGNLSNDPGSSPGQAPRSYGYTSENRLAISGNVSLTYDPVGRLLVSDTGTANTRFDHLGDEMILELNSANAIQSGSCTGPEWTSRWSSTRALPSTPPPAGSCMPTSAEASSQCRTAPATWWASTGTTNTASRRARRAPAPCSEGSATPARHGCRSLGSTTTRQGCTTPRRAGSCSRIRSGTATA